MPLTLKALEGVSGEVNSLLLSGVEWSGGVNRWVMFKIAVGKCVVTTAFYYSSDVHDQMRADALAELKKERPGDAVGGNCRWSSYPAAHLTPAASHGRCYRGPARSPR